jgi:hypothetical protein
MVRVPGYRSWGPGFDSRRYQIFWEVVGLERGPLSLMRIIEELLEWKSSGSGQENRINDRGIRCADHVTPSIRKKLARTSPKSGGRSVGIVRFRTKRPRSFLCMLPFFLSIETFVVGDVLTSSWSRSGGQRVVLISCEQYTDENSEVEGLPIITKKSTMKTDRFLLWNIHSVPVPYIHMPFHAMKTALSKHAVSWRHRPFPMLTNIL